MKIKSFLLVLLMVSFFDLILMSCECDCPDHPTEDAYLCELSVINLDNSGSSPVPGTDTINREAFGIQIDLSVSLTTLCSHQPVFFSGVYATSSCDCPPPLFNIANPVRDFKITTLQNYDISHPAGSEITDYFYRFDGVDYQAAIESVNPRTISTNNNIRYDLLLMEPPVLSGSYSFRIELLLSNGDTLSQTTSNVHLL